MISNFDFVCELLPFVKDNLFSNENTIIIAWVKTFQMFEFILMVYRKDKCGIMFKVIIRTLLIRVYGIVNLCLLVALMGDNSVPIFQICYKCNMKYALRSL